MFCGCLYVSITGIPNTRGVSMGSYIVICFQIPFINIVNPATLFIDFLCAIVEL